MPALTNPRHERFARYWLKTGNASAAYRRAGYHNTTRNGLDASASRLLRHSKVNQRIQEIRRQMTQRTRITLESLLRDLAEDRALARETKQVSAAIAATQLSAKLVGLLIERKESGAPGDFTNQTEAEVFEFVRKELGDETADALAAVFAKKEAEEVVERPADQPELDAGRSTEDRLN